MVGYLHGVLLDLSINKICGQDSIPIKSSTCGVFMLLQQISIITNSTSEESSFKAAQWAPA
jgi:hypothetical protein